MPDSNITKRALANTLKELMKEKSFAKISVTDICERCGMNRKSFYYHFEDKYDLVNWIFDMDYLAIIKKHAREDSWTIIRELCEHFYAERNYYRKVLKIEGQNSFREHFHDFLYSLFRARLSDLTKVEGIKEFQLNFFSDAVVDTFNRWLTSPNPITPEEFISEFKLCLECIKYINTNLS
ncbi:MAG: TetR/AcrR family transcriptional regulator C-terminal domain-containing protein [Erysipelotrichaceae bacterium]